MTIEVRIEEVRPQHAVAVIYKTPMDKIGEAMNQAFGQVLAFLGSQGLRPGGRPFSVYPKMEPDAQGNMEVVSGMPVEGDVTGGADGVVEYVLPGGKVAVTTHTGPYEGLGRTYGGMLEWIREHRFVPAGAMWEYYLTDPNREPDQAKWRTDVYCPVAEG